MLKVSVCLPVDFLVVDVAVRGETRKLHPVLEIVHNSLAHRERHVGFGRSLELPSKIIGRLAGDHFPEPTWTKPMICTPRTV